MQNGSSDERCYLSFDWEEMDAQISELKELQGRCGTVANQYYGGIMVGFRIESNMTFPV